MTSRPFKLHPFVDFSQSAWWTKLKTLLTCKVVKPWEIGGITCVTFLLTILPQGKSVKFFWRKKISNHFPLSPIFFNYGFFNSLGNNTFIGFFFFLASLFHNVPCTYHSTQNTTAQRCRLHTYFGFTFILPLPLSHQGGGTPQLFLLLSFLFNTKSRWKTDW